jgi:hypothetical protein
VHQEAGQYYVALVHQEVDQLVVLVDHVVVVF